MLDHKEGMYSQKFRIKEVRLVAKPIQATPVLRGDDLVRLIRDVQRPDQAKEFREKASSMRRQAMERGRRYEVEKGIR